MNRPRSSSSLPGCSALATSGRTNWAHGLTGRDPQVEQITANLLDRLA
jgi:hypothetical protein